MIDMFHITVLSSIVFSLAVIGIFLNLNNLIKVFLCLEVMFLAVSINFVGYAAGQDVHGFIYALYVLTVAAAESAIGLAILILYFRQRDTLSTHAANRLKG